MRVPARLAIAGIFVVAVGGAAVAGLYVGRSEQVRQAAQEAAAPRSAPTTDEQIAALQQQIAVRRPMSQSYVGLGFLYLQKAREVGDPSSYPRAEASFRTAQELDATDADVYVGLGTLALARHEFADALAFGEKARALNPYKAAALGVIADAQTEMGRYEEAAAAVTAMLDLRPGLASYSRASYQRELRGDLAGAIEMMQKALTAGVPGTEGYAWTRVQLGNLYMQTGEITLAQREFDHALFEVPKFSPARAGVARIMAMRQDYAGAIPIYEEITRLLPLPEYVIALADVQRAAGKRDEAQKTLALVGVIDQLQRVNGMRTDVEMALFNADNDIDPEVTVENARAALTMRASVHGYDAYAWALYKAGRYSDAQAASDQALRLGSKDSLIRFHAGMIALKLGQSERARAELRQALAVNPRISIRYTDTAAATLRQLESSTAAR